MVLVRYSQIIFNYVRQILLNGDEDAGSTGLPSDGSRPQATSIHHAHVLALYLRESAAILTRFGVVPHNIQIVNLL